MSWLSDLTSKMEDLTTKVQDALPIDSKTLQKFTLTSPELVEERRRIDREELQKEAVKDRLSGLLPWQTRDAEREILVEECKEAILALSSDDDTFFGPYTMPELPDTGEKEEDVEEEDDEEEEETKKEPRKPSDESLEKLAKLEPLPTLLANFDLDSHVGLIQRLFSVDQMLVDKQSTLSGAGERERTFWHNYFFHCAFTRYEAGLSIDEIWSDQPDKGSDSEVGIASVEEEESSASETITFEPNQPASASGSVASTASDKMTPTASVETKKSAAKSGLFEASSPDSPPSIDSPQSLDGGDYDMLESSELDELEAEIARELED